MKRGTLAAAVAVVAAMAAGSHALGQSLVVNGGFETGGFFPWLVPPNVPLGQPDPQYFQINNNTPHGGTYFGIMSSTQLRFISQVLPTTAGSDYELSFWIRRTSLGPDNFIVRWEGNQVLDLFPTNLDNFTWQRYSLSLHSNITGSLLAFGQSYFPQEYHIDDISVVQVPAPGAAAVMVVGGAVAVLRRRRGITAETREVAG